MENNTVAENSKAKATFDDLKIVNAKLALLDNYSKQLNSQGTRLIGFVAGLFALLTLTESSGKSGLGNVFPNFTSIPVLADWFSSLLKLIFLIGATTVILYFIFRTIFRYSIYGYSASQVLQTSKEDAEKVLVDWSVKAGVDPFYKDREIWAVNLATLKEVYWKKLFFVFPACWFFSIDIPKCPARESFGSKILVCISFALAVMLLLFLW